MGGARLHVQLAPEQRDSAGQGWSATDTSRTSTKPPPKHPQRLGLPSAPGAGLNWHRTPGYPAILIPAPCPDQSSLPGSRILLGKANERPAPSGRSCSPSADVPDAGQGQALSHPSMAAGTISRPGQQPVTSFLSLWSRDSGFTERFGKGKQSSARTLSSAGCPGSHRSSFLPPSPVPSALLSRSCQQDFPCPHAHGAVSVHRPR